MIANTITIYKRLKTKKLTTTCHHMAFNNEEKNVTHSQI